MRANITAPGQCFGSLAKPSFGGSQPRPASSAASPLRPWENALNDIILQAPPHEIAERQAAMYRLPLSRAKAEYAIYSRLPVNYRDPEFR